MRTSIPANLVLDILCTATNVTFQEPFYRWEIIQEDPDDNKFADVAISASADALVTFDRHFGVFKQLAFPALHILHPKQFGNIHEKVVVMTMFPLVHHRPWRREVLASLGLERQEIIGLVKLFP